MGKAKMLLQDGGLSKDWTDPQLCCGMSSKEAWKDMEYDSVEERETSNTINRLSSMSSDYGVRFARSKFWGKVVKTLPALLARSAAEEL